MSIKHLKPRTPEELSLLPYPPPLNYSQIHSIEFDNIDYSDYPDFCDAFISSAVYCDREMTEEELDELNNDRDFVYDKLMDYLY